LQPVTFRLGPDSWTLVLAPFITLGDFFDNMKKGI
jgi:hypothetical protein